MLRKNYGTEVHNINQQNGVRRNFTGTKKHQSMNSIKNSVTITTEFIKLIGSDFNYDMKFSGGKLIVKI
jgi:hypothetical protein